ncbi:MAG: glycosyltransferase family 4 protein [Vulcanimicrobiaceae bacterium]|jgi:glycosyltransferase involved in cell wall biosynthesis
MSLPLLVIEGEVYSELSLARVNRELALALLRRGDVELGLSAQLEGAYLIEPSPPIQELVARTGIRLTRTPDLTVRHRWPPEFTRQPYGRYAHIQPFEFGALPRAWADGMAEVDEIWCYGNFVRDMYVRAGFAPERLLTVPLGVDPDVYRPDGERTAMRTRGAFRFLFVGGAIWRKGVDIALNAFLTAFGPDDDVTLIIKGLGAGSAYRDQTVRPLIEPLLARADLPEIIYSDEVLDDASLAALYRSADVLVLPYRAEGFGLTALEAMACGTPPLVTKGGATDDFVDASVGVQLPAARISVREQISDMPETVEPPWALEVDVALLAKVMRLVVQRRDQLPALGAAAAHRARTAWTWDRTAALVAARAYAAAA